MPAKCPKTRITCFGTFKKKGNYFVKLLHYSSLFLIDTIEMFGYDKGKFSPYILPDYVMKWRKLLYEMLDAIYKL